MVFRSLALPLAFLAAAPALAQEAQPADTGGDVIVLGAGAAILPDYEGSDDSTWAPVPAATGRISGFNFSVIGNRASVDLIPDSVGPGWDFQAGPVGVLNLNRASVKGIDDARVKALGKIGTAIELGGYVGIGRVGVITSDYDRLSVSASYRYDVSGVHKSGVFTPSITYMTPLSRRALVGIFGSAERVESGYADTYFGVTPEGAVASGLPVFNPRGGWKSWTAGAGGALSLTGDLTGGLQLFGGGTYRRLINDFADSPLVRTAGSRHQWMGVLGLAYSF